MRLFRSILTAGIALAVLSSSALALTLPVSEDSSTSGNSNAARSAGRDTTLRVSDARQGLIRFEAGAFADTVSATDVSKARLVIFISSVTAPGALTLHRVTQDWSEHGTGAPTYDSKPLATIPRSSVVAKQFVIIDVTAAVQGWLREPGTDFGFAIAGSDGARVLLGAKEGPAAGHPAQLQIEATDGGAISLEGGDDAEKGGAGGGRTRAAGTPNNSIRGAKLKSGTVTGDKLTAGTVSGRELAANSVNSANIVDGTITNADLATGFTFPTPATLAPNSVGSANIIDRSIANADLGVNSVDTGNIIDGTITNSDLSPNFTLPPSTIANGSITVAKLDPTTVGFWSAAGGNFFRATGKVGVGTATPLSLLDVNGSLHVGSYVADATPKLITFGDNDAVSIGENDSNDTMQLTAARFAFSNGNVGIGTTSPRSHLDVNGAIHVGSHAADFTPKLIGFGDFDIVAVGEDSDDDVMLLQAQSYKFSGNNVHVGRYAADNVAKLITFGDSNLVAIGEDSNDNSMQLKAARFNFYGGSVRIGTTVTSAFKLDVNGSIRCIGAVNTSSDARYKTNIRPVVSALDTVGALRGVSYDWDRAAFPEKNFPQHRSFGFIAQEIEKVLPDVVSKDAQGYYSVAYSEVIPVLVEATKELRDENAALRARLGAQEKRLAELEAKDKAREARLTRLESSLDDRPARAVRASLDLK